MAYYDKATGKVVYGNYGNTATKPSTPTVSSSNTSTLGNINTTWNPTPITNTPKTTSLTGTFADPNKKDTSTVNETPAPVDPLAEYKRGIAETEAKYKASATGTNAVNDFKTNAPTQDFEGTAKYLQDALQAQIAARQAEINQAKQRVISQQQEIMSQAPQEFQALRNQADVRGAQNAQALKSMLANLGQSKGGFGMSAMAKENANTSNLIGGYDQQQQNTINTARRAMSDAEAAAGFQEIQTAQGLSANLMNQLAALKQSSSDSAYRKWADIMNASLNLNSQDNSNAQFAAQLGSSNANNLFNSGLNLANVTGYMPNGTQTLAGQNQGFTQGLQSRQQNNNDLMNSTQITGMNIDNKYKPLEYQANIEGRNLSNVGQGLTNTGMGISNQKDQMTLDNYGNVIKQSNDRANLENQGLTTQNKTAEYTLNNILPVQLDEMKQALSMGDAKLAQQILETKLYPSVVNSQVNQNNAGAYAARKNADTNESARKDAANNNNQIRQDSFNNTKDQADYQDSYDAFVKQFATPTLNPTGQVTGYTISDTNKAIIRDRLAAMKQDNFSSSVINKLANNLDIR